MSESPRLLMGVIKLAGSVEDLSSRVDELRRAVQKRAEGQKKLPGVSSALVRKTVRWILRRLLLSIVVSSMIFRLDPTIESPVGWSMEVGSGSLGVWRCWTEHEMAGPV